VIDFYFDFISPFGYFASLRIDQLAEPHGLKVRWHPILIGVTVMKTMGLPPIFDIPLKGDYIKRELTRYQRLFDVPLRRNPFDPPATALAASRAMALLLRENDDLSVRFAKAAYAAYWQDCLDLNLPETVELLAVKVGVSAAQIARCLGDEAKAALREQMDQATRRGVFGSPYLIIDDEPFFGVDKFELVDIWLSTRGRVTAPSLTG
jgi:2-hydroxychromene-2-carboxylate isomerase